MMYQFHNGVGYQHRDRYRNNFEMEMPPVRYKLWQDKVKEVIMTTGKAVATAALGAIAFVLFFIQL